MTMMGREAAVKSRYAPPAPPIYYPICGDWSCDDEYDWEFICPNDEDYAAVKREYTIVTYHEPREDWRRRLEDERDRLSGGDPLWWGKPKHDTPTDQVD